MYFLVRPFCSRKSVSESVEIAAGIWSVIKQTVGFIYGTVCYFQRLQYSPKDQNIAEKDPERFAMLLTHRLLNIHASHETGKTFDPSPLASFQKTEVCHKNREKQ